MHPQNQTSDEDIARATIGELRPYAVPVVIEEYNAEWPAQFRQEEELIRAALGVGALRVEHTGSTSVPGLPAKPIIDITLLVEDSARESAYVGALEQVGYQLRIRDVDWYEHRCLRKRTEDGAPHSVNLHVFSPRLAAEEIERVLTFRNWLRTQDEDRDRYAAVKKELAARRWKYVQNYADAKSEIIEEILARAFAARTSSSISQH